MTNTRSPFFSKKTASYLDVQVALTVHVIEQFLIVAVLRVPLARLVVPEVVAEWSHDDRATGARSITIELCFLSVLIEQQVGTISNIPIRYRHRSYFPWTGDFAARKSLEVELAADCRLGTAGVRDIVRVKGHHVTEDVRVADSVCKYGPWCPVNSKVRCASARCCFAALTQHQQWSLIFQQLRPAE